MEKVTNNVNPTIVVYTYKYTWQTKDGKLCVKFITDVPSGHAQFEKALRNDSNIESALAEYISEVNFAFINLVRSIKVKENQGDKKEEVTTNETL